MAIEREIWGEMNGQPVERFVLTRGAIKAVVTGYGATLTELHVPDRHGHTADIVLGPGDFAGYRSAKTFFGATAGRYANRIADGRFPLDGVIHQLSRNEGANHLHGGRRGFDKVLWAATPDTAGDAVRFTYRSPDGEEGYPGTLDIAVTYLLGEDGTLEIDFTAVTDRPTLCNPVHHSYFNLEGHDSGTVADQLLAVEADFYTPVGAGLIPTGEIRTVVGTPFDFRTAKPIGRDLAAASADGTGYDHNLVLSGEPGLLRSVVRAEAPRSGRILELATTEPGLQLYTAGYLDGAPGKGGCRYPRFGGFTLETQKFPNSPNLGHFPSARLDPGQTYRHRMVFRFTVR